MGKKHKQHVEVEEKTEDDITIDLSKIREFFSSISAFRIKESGFINKTTMTWALIIVLMALAFYIRAFGYDHAIADDWASQTILANVGSNIESQLRQQRPDLPDSAIREEVSKQIRDFYKANRAAIDTQEKQLASQFREELQDDKGIPYLSDIDSYLWYSYAKWYERTGFFGDKILNGEEWFSLRNGRIGQGAGFVSHAFAMVIVHKVAKVFNPSQDMMSSAYFATPFIMMLAIIPAFFLGRKIGGTVGGIIAAAMIGTMPSILGRTISADNDAYTFVLPLLIVWLFLESIDSKNTRTRIIYSAATGLSIALFRIMWSGWWFAAGLVGGLTVIYIAYTLVRDTIETKKFVLKREIMNAMPGIVIAVSVLISLLAFSALLGALIGENVGSSLALVLRAPLEPVNFVLGFKGAAEGVSVGAGEFSYPLWPNVFTTVAELNPGNFATLIGAGGGKLFLFAALLGTFSMFVGAQDKNRKFYAILLALWIASTFYSGLVGIRFTALFAPTVVFGIAALVGFFTMPGSEDRKYKRLGYAALAVSGFIVLTSLLSLTGLNTNYFLVQNAVEGLIIIGAGAAILGLCVLKDEGQIGAWFFTSLFLVVLIKVLFPSMMSSYYIIASMLLLIIGYAMDSGKKLDTEMNASMTKVAISLAAIFLFVISTIGTSVAITKGNVAMYDDAWDESMQIIYNSSSTAITTSWWDFGHWFQARSERTVTFDGGDQGKRIHWVGRSLQTSDEDEAVDILRMLNCGQEKSYDELIGILKDPYDTTLTLKQIIRQDKAEADKILQEKGLDAGQRKTILNLTHCEDLIDNYFITSDDMIGKAGVWAHFGLWDFNRSYMYYVLKSKPANDAVKIATEKLGYTEQQARELYLQLQTIYSENDANVWISPWPNYVTGSPVKCSYEINMSVAICAYNMGIGSQSGLDLQIWRGVINLTKPEDSFLVVRAVNPQTGQVVSQTQNYPSSIVMAGDDGFERYATKSASFPYELLVWTDDSGNYNTMLISPELTESIFTKLYYLDGKYTKHFEKVSDKTGFRGNRIITWKVDFSSREDELSK